MRLQLLVVVELVSSVRRNTPDNWVPRDPGLVRLTGKHPFNCEAKLDRLFDAVRTVQRRLLSF